MGSLARYSGRVPDILPLFDHVSHDRLSQLSLRCRCWSATQVELVGASAMLVRGHGLCEQTIL